MKVRLKTKGSSGIGSYNFPTDVRFICSICETDLEPDDDGIMEHPSEVDEGFLTVKMRKLDCPQVGMKARAEIDLPNIQ